MSALAVEDVADGGDVVLVSARTRGGPVPCPACGTPTEKIHGFHTRTLADVPVDGRRARVSVRLRRLVCQVLGCPRQTFREQVPGVVERHQRRTNRFAAQLGAVVKELAGRAGARISRFLAVPASRSSALRTLRALPVPVLFRNASLQVVGGLVALGPAWDDAVGEGLAGLSGDEEAALGPGCVPAPSGGQGR
ncbi:transposase family protein [Streptomyces sp. NPDC059467]|uniref:transposase family protein n=1 Tax=Streptomyces sp. NPDC059467 TaxID=3346844 RepID=UPI003680A88E